MQVWNREASCGVGGADADIARHLTPTNWRTILHLSRYLRHVDAILPACLAEVNSEPKRPGRGRCGDSAAAFTCALPIAARLNNVNYFLGVEPESN